MIFSFHCSVCPCPCPSVSWLASAHPLEVWHPLHSNSICQQSLLHFTALRQVTALAPKYSLQAEIRGRVTEWQEFDQSPRTQTHAHTQEILMSPLSSWRYFVTAPLDERLPPKNPAQLPPQLPQLKVRWWEHHFYFIFSSSLVLVGSFLLLPSMHPLPIAGGGGVFWFCLLTALLRAGGRAKGRVGLRWLTDD